MTMQLEAAHPFLAHCARLQACWQGGASLSAEELAEELSELDDSAWSCLDSFRRQLRKKFSSGDEAPSSLLFGLIAGLSNEEWRSVNRLRAHLQLARKEDNDELYQLIVGTMKGLMHPPAADELVLMHAPSERADESEPDRPSFRRRYLKYKAESNLDTIDQVAHAAGVSPATIRAIERGDVRPQFRTVRKIAEAFGVPVDELWD